MSINLPKAKFLWLICATPRDILRPYRQYLSNLIDTLTYKGINLTKYLIIRNSDEFVDSSLKLPEFKEVIIKCKSPTYYRHIRDNLTNEALTALRANDISGAIAALRCNADSQSNIVDVLILNLKDSAFNEQIEIDRLRQLRNLNTLERNNRIAIHQKKLDSFNTRINSIKERVGNSNNICPICLDDVQSPVAITGCCQNSYCFECILMSLNLSRESRCPMCKTPCTTKDLHINVDNVDNVNIKTEKCENTLKSKSDTLLNLIKNKTDESRFLVFSEYSNSFNEIMYKLDTNNIKCSELKGCLASQQKTIGKFVKGCVQVLLLDAGHFGAGLDLHMTTDVIIYHKFRNDDLRKQVIGRAQRLGRTKSLKVSYLKFDDE